MLQDSLNSRLQVKKVLIKLLKCSKTLGSCQMSMYKSSISLNKDLVLSSLNCKVA